MKNPKKKKKVKYVHSKIVKHMSEVQVNKKYSADKDKALQDLNSKIHQWWIAFCTAETASAIGSEMQGYEERANAKTTSA